jgi:hypothetical protein
MPRPVLEAAPGARAPGSIARVNAESTLSAVLPPDPALIAAGAALAAQRAALAVAAARLESARARVPAAAAGDSWRGLAQRAYAAGVHDLGRGVDEAIHSVRVAQQCTASAVASIAGRVG